MALTSFPTSPLFRFIRKRSGPYDGEVTLDSRRVYILPSRTGLMFCMLLLLLLVGSVNYEKSLGYALTFLLAGIGNVAILTTWKNLKGLVVRAGGCAPVFAGEQARFSIRLANPDDDARYSIAVHHADIECDVGDIPANGETALHFDVDTGARGLMPAGPCKISTEYPFGLFVAWTWVDLNMQCLVYPAPARQLPEISPAGDDEGEGDHGSDGLEVFDGLRSFQQGDSYKKVSWKSFARNRELMIKQYSGGAPVEHWIDWHQLSAANVEERLSMMCRMIVDADDNGQHYGLVMPDRMIEPDTGNLHRQQCLRELALYGKVTDAA